MKLKYDDLSAIEHDAISRAQELMTEWENTDNGHDSIAAAHAYAALALAAGQRIARIDCYYQ
jgi:hypothetical protein